jgi:hypothetical protein
MRRVFAVAPVLLLLAACASPIRTRFDVAPDADFARYHSYAWMRQDPAAVSSRSAASGSGYVSPLDDRRLREAVNDDLARKGYHRVTDLERADLVVRYQVARKEKVQVTQDPSRSTIYRPGYGYSYGSWYGTSPTRVTTYTEGTLSIEFYDRRSREAVWVGWAQKRLSKSDDSASLIKRAVDALLAPLPRAGGAPEPAEG